MNIEKYLTKNNLQKVEQHIKMKLTENVSYKNYNSILPKLGYCKKKNYMPYSFYMFYMIDDIIMECAIKGRLRYVIIENDINKIKPLAKDIPYTLKMKILNIIKNRYIISKLNIYEYIIKNSSIKSESYKTCCYLSNSIYMFIFSYMKYFKNYKENILSLLLNTTDNTLNKFYYNLSNNINNIELSEYINNTNIKTIIQNKYDNNEQKYKDFYNEIKKYDNFKLLKDIEKKNEKNALKSIHKILYSNEFRNYVIQESKKMHRYKFNDKLYRSKCKKAGILKEYEEVINLVDSCDK